MDLTVPPRTATGSRDASGERQQDYKQVTAMFLHSIGAHYYGLVRDLVAPDSPLTKSYHELKTILRKHLKSTPMVVAERRKFIRRDQTPDESTSDYIVQLKHLSLHCSYNEKLDEQLRDRFISGINNESTSLQLMEKATENPQLTFQQGCRLRPQQRNSRGGGPCYAVTQFTHR